MVRFKDLKLEGIDTVHEVELLGQKVEIKTYVPVKNKVQIVNQAVKAAVVDGIVDELLMDTFLHFMIIRAYTNIEFDTTDIGNMLETFDLLESNGVIGSILGYIPEQEYNTIYDAAKATMSKTETLLSAISSGMGGIATAMNSAKK